MLNKFCSNKLTTVMYKYMVKKMEMNCLRHFDEVFPVLKRGMRRKKMEKLLKDGGGYERTIVCRLVAGVCGTAHPL